MTNDRDLRKAFDRLRSAEEKRVPAFDDVWGRARAQRRLRRRTRRVLQLAVAVILVCAVVVAWWGDGEDELLDGRTGPSIVSWEAPTDRLLRPLSGAAGPLDWSDPTDALLHRPDSESTSIRPPNNAPTPK